MSARLAECDKNLEMLADILTNQTLHVPEEVLWDSYASDWAERENQVCSAPRCLRSNATGPQVCRWQPAHPPCTWQQ